MNGKSLSPSKTRCYCDVVEIWLQTVYNIHGLVGVIGSAGVGLEINHRNGLIKVNLDSFRFNNQTEKEPTFQRRIVAIKGDCSLSNLGISKIDRAILTREVSIVFNVAATVRFNEKLKSAITINIRSLRDLINLSKEMPKLKSFVHVSTVYANCLYNPIEEKFYDPPIDADKLIDLVNSLEEKMLDYITPKLLGRCPNTYVYTKSVAESVVKKHAGTIPIGIFRPGIVISTYKEPVSGWIDNVYGPVGITASVIIGLMRIHHCDGLVKANLIPGDLTINGLIASAWDIANNPR
ncbi:hypothetical protein HZH68_017121 [Vespula germanica]|uniref:Fatty acyl-CoA reductase n=1 Tax=Vespula germanica TaxID=30212 RepID=A0A834J5A2_VESGE|nr:hypothetical protein HZH68_017121 [Vespula germanica]